MEISIAILAAGKGTRMKSSLPKVLHKICGKPMIYHIIKEALKISKDITVILGHEAKAVEDIIKTYFSDIKIAYQDLDRYPGTGGALKELDFSKDRVLILNGDMPLITSQELEKFLKVSADIVMSILELENPKGYGRVVIKNDKVLKIVEQKDATEEELKIKYVNAGVYLIKKDLLKKFLSKMDNNNAQGEYYLTDIIEYANKRGYIIKPLIVDEEDFKGVNTKLDLSLAEEIMQERIKKELMLNGVTIRLPKSVFIEEGVKFEGECEIESGVVIRGDSFIKNSHIKTNSVIEDSHIEYCTIGPMARIRPKSFLKDTHIGNFVEVKKSKLLGVKAGHLSYLGDSEIDEGTNIGAGTITCNYDGKNKYKTKIGKNVFVGSDTQLIAPITIEDDVIIAAGTTLTKDIKKGSLAISRSPLKIVKDFYYKFFNKEGK